MPRRTPRPGRRNAWFRSLRLAGAALLTLAGLQAVASDAAEKVLGLPFTRFYSFEEIGEATRGARLGFDHLGRIAVTRSGSCIVLNDTTWVDVADKKANGIVMQRVAFGPDGEAYYGTFGSWGVAQMTDGTLRPSSLVQPTHPKWVLNSNFSELLAVNSGVYFVSLNGVVYRHHATNQHAFFEIPGIDRIFSIGQQVFVTTALQGIYTLDGASGTMTRTLAPRPNGTGIDQVTAFDAARALVAGRDGRLAFFDGSSFSPFPGPFGEKDLGRVSALTRLADGNIAVAIHGNGLYFISAEGVLLSSLTTPEYHRITDLAAREPGVLWLVNESGIEKVLYDDPLTVFGQRLGLPISWPQVVNWNNHIVVASGGRLYETVAGTPGETTRFQLVPNQPAASMWGLASAEGQLLVGTNQDLFVRKPDGTFASVLSGFDVARLVYVNDILYVFGSAEITAMRYVDGRWSECAPRVPGLGYPLLIHGNKHAAWVELGQNRAARVRFDAGRLHVRVFDDFPWKSARWINLGFADDTVVLSGLPDGRLFFDEKTEKVTTRHELEQLLNQSPYPLTRFRQDQEGTIWATHDEGLVTIRRGTRGVTIDATTFGKIDDRFPFVHLLPDGDVWLGTGQSLFHVNRRFGFGPKPEPKPLLVSLSNGRTHRELLAKPGAVQALPAIGYEENSLVFRFFAGSYALRRPPAYEFRLHRGGSSWTTVGNGSLLTLTDLREGAYRLEARILDAREPASATLAIEFAIAPPWYRTWYAYICYALGIGTVVYGLMRWSAQRTRSRNVVLENLVAERTNELRVAMQQLNEETRTSATLAERDRLAGEIHDSLQQGLSGLMLHLDATLKLADLPGDVRSRLGVARNMVSFTRHEVQHAVWDMETPLLEGTELGDALRKITALIGPGTASVQIDVHGKPADLPPAIKHHLLRIAQEAITNAVRHAAARTITIALTYEPVQVSLSVTDDGNGFVPNEVLTKGLGHFGLRGLRGRASKVGGELHIDSAPGRGTVVRVVVPTGTPAPTPAPLYVHDR